MQITLWVHMACGTVVPWRSYRLEVCSSPLPVHLRSVRLGSQILKRGTSGQSPPSAPEQVRRCIYFNCHREGRQLYVLSILWHPPLLPRIVASTRAGRQLSSLHLWELQLLGLQLHPDPSLSWWSGSSKAETQTCRGFNRFTMFMSEAQVLGVASASTCRWKATTATAVKPF